MTIPFWCLFIAVVLPYVWFSFAAPFRAMQFGKALDNHTPRSQEPELRGRAARAQGAHTNSLEALAYFSPAVLVAHLTHADPEWSARLAKILSACEALAAATPASTACGIHRDFYPSQVIVDGHRLWLLDFDLYCLGDPALDAGNFIGHVTEKALRELGHAKALEDFERVLEDSFLELSGQHTRAAVHTYAVLTLARHIFLSTRFTERAHLTEKLIELCEARLGLPSRAG